MEKVVVRRMHPQKQMHTASLMVEENRDACLKRSCDSADVVRCLTQARIFVGCLRQAHTRGCYMFEAIPGIFQITLFSIGKSSNARQRNPSCHPLWMMENPQWAGFLTIHILYGKHIVM